MSYELKKTNLIIITGMDGTGKTTLAKFIIDHLKCSGYRTKYVWMRHHHTIAFLLSQILIKLGWETEFINQNNVKIKRLYIKKQHISQIIWLFIEYISIIIKIFLSVYIPILLGYKVVTDRYVIDTIITLKLQMKTRSFKKIEKILMSLIPKNTRIIVLTANISTILKRRNDIEFTYEEILTGLKYYEEYSLNNNLYIFNTSNYNQNEIFNQIFKIIYFGNIQLKPINYNPDNISVILPTINRSKTLRNTLKSICNQDYYINDTIIVDQSSDDKTYKLYLNFKKIFNKRNINISYYHIIDKSASKARNYGISKSVGDIIFFIDDDVILDKKYVKEIMDLYRKKSYAVGIQGIIYDFKNGYGMLNQKEKLYNIIKKFLFLGHYCENKWIVLPSINDVFPFPITKDITIERMQGICSFKRDILLKYKFDENISGWSFLEDFDISYNIYKSNMGLLYLSHKAKLYHMEHVHNVDNIMIQSYKKIINRIYMFYKHIDQTPINIFIFYLSIFGFIFTTIISRIFGRYKEKSNLGPVYMIKGLIYAIKNLDTIKSRNIVKLPLLEVKHYENR